MLNTYTNTNTNNNTNRIRIKTKFTNSKMTPSSLNKSLNLTNYNTSAVNNTHHNNNAILMSMNQVPSSNNLRMRTQMKRINRATNMIYTNRLNDSVVTSTTHKMS